MAQGGDPVAREPSARAVREHLVFFLGLVPATIAAMRVYLMAQGDVGTMLTLIRTLDVRALFFGTFIRFIGVFGVASTSYAFVRVHWPHLSGRTGRRVGWSSLTVVILLFVASVGCLYPEQIVDTGTRTLAPVDLLRALGWCALGYLILRVLRFWLLAGRHREGPPRPLWRKVFDRNSVVKAEVLLVAPAVLLLFWQYLVTNDRMWLPPQVVVLHSAPVDLIAHRDGRSDPVLTRPDGGVAFIGFVVDADEVESTIVRPGGGVVVVRRADVADLRTCQYEPDFDPDDDSPLIDRVTGVERVAPDRQNHTCTDVLADAQHS